MRRKRRRHCPAAVELPACPLPIRWMLCLSWDELMLEVGAGLVSLVDAKQGGQLLTRIKALRKNLAQQLGFLVPSIHITDNLSLKGRRVCRASAWNRDCACGAAPRTTACDRVRHQCTAATGDRHT